MKLVLMVPQGNRIASVDALLAATDWAEELGFWGVSVRDHLVFNGSWISMGAIDTAVEGDDRDLYEPMQTLAFLAARTEHLRLQTGVIVLPSRHPLVLANEVASLDVLSGGRVNLGLGVGPPLRPGALKTTKLGTHRTNVEKEMAAIGASGPRGPRLDEYLEAMIALWTQESASYHGRWVDFEALDVFPKPLQRPYPPIFIGGRSDHALRRTARYGQGWVPSQVTVSEIAAGVARLGELYAEEGRHGPEEVGINQFVAVASTDEKAAELAYPTASRVFHDDEAYQARTIIGSPQTFARRLAEYADAGATFLEMRPVYRTLDELRHQMELLVEEVIPSLEA